MSNEDLWRIAVVELVDEGESVRARIGVGAAAILMADGPGPTWHSGLVLRLRN